MRQVEAWLVLFMPALQSVLRRVTQLTNSYPDALPQFDVELDRSNGVLV